MNRSSFIHSMGYHWKTSLVLGLIATLFICNNAFGQTDAVNLSSGNFKPDKKSSACVECLCLCLQASLDFANLSETYASPGVPGVNDGYKTKVGFNIGAYASKSILSLGPGQLAVKGGLEFIEKGGKYSNSPVTETIGLNYIELPIVALYQYEIMDDGFIFGGLGPYFAYGIGGKDKYDDGNTTTTSSSFGGGSGGDGFKRFDFGLQFTAGYRISCMLSASLAYEIGFLNFANNSNNGGYGTYNDKNKVFSINLAYCLGK
jgi:Outer membrane protein beta-barrel domain